MSQRKAAVEENLERLENWLARGSRSKKILEILTVKVSLISNPDVRQTALEDIEELRRITHEGQGAINWVIKALNL